MNLTLKYAFLCIISLFYITMNTTMGDSSALTAKNVNFYGTLETYSGDVKNVEHITFWNKNIKTHVFEAPKNLNTISPKEKRIELPFNPVQNATVATIELREIQTIEVENNQMIFAYTEKNKLSQDYIIMKVMFHGAKEPNYYLIPVHEKIYVKQETGIESIELEVHISSIKKLEIKGHHIEDKETT